MVVQQTTKDLLAASLKELAQKKSIDKISVKELVRNAGLTSATFYNHFSNKYELVAWIYTMQISKVMEEFLSKYSWYDVVCKFMQIIQEAPEFYENALKSTYGRTSFCYAVNNFAIDMVAERIRCHHTTVENLDDVLFYIKYYMRFIAEAVNDWFLEGRAIPKEQIAAKLVTAMPEPLRPLLAAFIPAGMEHQLTLCPGYAEADYADDPLDGEQA